VKAYTIVSELERNATSTHTMVSEIHRTMVKGQPGQEAGGKDPSVCDTSTLAVTE